MHGHVRKGNQVRILDEGHHCEGLWVTPGQVRLPCLLQSHPLCEPWGNGVLALGILPFLGRLAFQGTQAYIPAIFLLGVGEQVQDSGREGKSNAQR